MNSLTPPQQKTLNFLKEEALAGRPAPTHREIAKHFGFRSHHAAACIIQALKKKGFVESQRGKARSLTIRLLDSISGLNIPLLGSIPAGVADDREQGSDGCVSVDVVTIGLKPTRNTFALRVVGDSMVGVHICHGDIVILEHGPEPRHGQIVAALIDHKSTLKTFVLKNGKPFLRAENPKYRDLIPFEELMIQGVFRALIRKPRE